jgi:four helix bundle protein
MAINNFRELRVWQSGMELVEQIYRLTQLFPHHEQYGLTSQLRRCAISIPSNIAEGHAREHLKEYLYHVSVAQGSLAELQTQIEIAERLSYLSHDQSEQLLNTAESLSRQLYALRNALSKRG